MTVIRNKKECATHRAAHFGDMPISAQRSEHAQASVGNSPATLVRIDVSKPQVTNLKFRDDVAHTSGGKCPTVWRSRTRLFDRTDQLAKFAQNHGRTMIDRPRVFIGEAISRHSGSFPGRNDAIVRDVGVTLCTLLTTVIVFLQIEIAE